MIRHRFRNLVERPFEREQVPTSMMSVDGFVVCPLVVQQWLAERPCQWDVYQRAWQQALDLAQPSVLDRYEAAFLN